MPEQADAAALAQSFPHASPACIAQLAAYVALLAKWARIHNLVGTKSRRGILALVRDCRALLERAASIDGPACDLGSGAGLPGVPLALLQPAREVALVEAEASKCAFLEQAVIELELGNARVVHQRIEDWRPRAVPQLLCMRGLASLARAARLARHLIRPGTRVLALKAKDPTQEIAALEQQGDWRIVACLPTGGRPSRFVVEAEAR